MLLLRSRPLARFCPPLGLLAAANRGSGSRNSAAALHNLSMSLSWDGIPGLICGICFQETAESSSS